MEIVRVEASRTYEVRIERGLLSRAGEEIYALGKKGKAVVVSDDTVAALYGDTLENSLKKQGFCTLKFIFSHGEASKCPETLFALWRFLAENRVTRSDLVVALGGGVVGDLAGFAAATYLRGIEVVQIPTTLLAMVDSSVGGKTAVDLPEGKNLAGAFWQPSLVLCDPDTLQTLSPDVFRDGMAEVIKYGLLNRKELFDALFTMDKEKDITAVIRTSVEDKRDIVSEDERDTGVRQLLNLGHTAAHGIERASGYTVPHGSAVAIGMVIVTRAAVKRGICQRETLDRLLSLLSVYGLPTSTDYTARELADAAMGDKKRAGGTITLVVPYGIGDARLYPMAVDGVESFFSEGLSE